MPLPQLNKVYCSDNVTFLQKEIPDNSIDLTVTSPPYDALRDYTGYSFEFGLIAEELYRVTKVGGILVWVVGDQVVDGSETATSFRQALKFMDCGFKLHDTMIYEKNGASFPARRDSNRYSQIFEYMFVLSKGKPAKAHLICDKANRWAGQSTFGIPSSRNKDGSLRKSKGKVVVADFSPRNNIWKYNTGKGYSASNDMAHEHPAIFPEALAGDHIVSWSGEGDIVLDPFCGSGTTLVMAKRLARNYIGIDISQEYVDLCNRRLDAG